MNPIRLSYIVPVYNTAPWLRVCLDSVLRYQDDDVEIIVINDGSTDGSGEIADSYALSDSRVRVVHQPNQGLSSARNAGMLVARGEYVLFVDSDDRVDARAIAVMLEVAQREDADVVVGRIMCEVLDGSLSAWGQFLAPMVFPSGFAFMEAVNARASYFPMVFGYMFRRKITSDSSLEFVPGLIHEDELWTPQLLARAGRVVVTDHSHYFYRTGREGSIMNSRDAFDRCLSIAAIVKALTEDAGRLLSEWTFVECRRALPFYLRRVSVLSAIIDGIASRQGGATALLRDFALGRYMCLREEISKERRSRE